MECLQDNKHNMIKNLHNAVKLCQTEFVNKTEVATESNIIVVQLCKEWETIFFHGIKKRHSKNIFSLKSNNLSEIPSNIIQQIKPFSNQNNYSFWSFICEFLVPDDIIRFTDTLDKIDTEIGRCRSWLRSAINEQTLEPFFVKIVSQSGQNITRKYYESHAILLDGEENAILPNLAAGISSIMFALELNNEAFNNFPDSNHRSQNNSTSSSVSRPVLFSSSTSGSFEDIEIIESVTKHINGESGIRNNSRKKNRIINIIPIDDDTDVTSDSSDLYSPFNLLKNSVLNTGLNLVSKFQFGNEDKLSNIQEHENNTPLTQSNHNSTYSSNPALIDGGFREFDETEFEDCCLSLQQEFYSPVSNELLTNNHIDNSIESTNQNFLSADLLAVDPVVVTSSSLSNISPVSSDSISPTCPGIMSLGVKEEISIGNHIQENLEIVNLKNQLLLKTLENDRLRNELICLKKDHEDQNRQQSEECSKLSRENELLKKRLKSLIVQSQTTEIFESDEFSENSKKLEQLLQMHADILELNDQLQRSLVDKDVKVGMLQSKISQLMHHEEASGIHFDKYGTIYIGIVDSFQRRSGSQKHFCYKINIRCCPLSSDLSIIETDEWSTCRRYSEFHRFYLDFISKNPNLKNISFPSKWLYKPTEEQLYDRQKGLESFLHIAIAYIFQNSISRNGSENNFKPVTYESFKRPTRFGWGSIETGSNHSFANYSDESLTCNQVDVEGNILYRRNIISIIPFLAPNSEES